jgi:class 3 adenylate cyclase
VGELKQRSVSSSRNAGRSARSIGRVALVPALYAAVAYAAICCFVYALNDPAYHSFFGNAPLRLYKNLRWFLAASIGGAALLILITYAVPFAFPFGRAHTFGMLLLASLHFLVALASALYFNHSHFLMYAWPGLLSVAVLWTRSIETAYPSDKRWKWEAMSFALLILAIIAFIPYCWGISNQAMSQGVFLRKNGIVAIQGLGLLLLVHAVARRLSPPGEPHGFATFLRLVFALFRVTIQSYQRGRSVSEVGAAVEETIRNLLSDIKGQTRRTILYTDIERSTEMIESLGDLDAYRLFQASWEISCREILRFHGSPPKDLGDGLLTTFGTGLAAVNAAIAIQRSHAIFNETRPAGHKLGLRIGVNTGNIFLHQGWDPRGYDSHLAQRVTAAAQPGQILITRSTYDEIQGDDSGLQMRPLSAGAVKGIRAQVVMFEVS